MEKVLLLNQEQIDAKLLRMAYQIWEANSNESEIEIIGVKDGGVAVAKNIMAILKKISPLKVNFSSIGLNKFEPLAEPIEIKGDFNNKIVVLVDDVANSGKTLLYALKPLLDFNPTKILICVLVDRKHKNYPIIPDIIGHSVSTTLQDHIVVTYENNKISGAYLE